MTDDRLGPPPVEPLSEAAWSRVERGVWSALDTGAPAGAPAPRSPRRWWLAAAPLAAAAAVAALVLVFRGEPVSPDPARVVSDASPVSVSFADSHIQLDPASALVMSHEAAHPTVMLERGAAWFTVAPRGARPSFIVRAGDAVVRVVGTKFQVARSVERIAVQVERGLVNVNFRGSIVPVGAGQRWSSDAPGSVLAVAATPPSVDPVVVAAPPADISERTAPQDAPQDAPQMVRMTPVKPHRPHLPASSAATGSAGVRPEPLPSVPPPGEVDADRDRAEYDRLAALEAGSPEAALVGYMALAKHTSRWADPALFAAARLATDRHDARAKTFLHLYLTRFPGGANAADARQLLARLPGSKSE